MQRRNVSGWRLNTVPRLSSTTGPSPAGVQACAPGASAARRDGGHGPANVTFGIMLVTGVTVGTRQHLARPAHRVAPHLGPDRLVPLVEQGVLSVAELALATSAWARFQADPDVWVMILGLIGTGRAPETDARGST